MRGGRSQSHYLFRNGLAASRTVKYLVVSAIVGAALAAFLPAARVQIAAARKAVQAAPEQDVVSVPEGAQTEAFPSQ